MSAKLRRSHAVSSEALRAHLLQVIARHQRGDLAGAIAGYREVLAVDPRQFDALRLLGAALNARREPQAALEALERALAVRGDMAEVWVLRGEALARLGRNDESVASFERALQLRPQSLETWHALGLRQYALGRHEEALRCFDRTLALDERLALAWCNRGVMLDALQRPAEAVQSYDRALQCDPALASAWSNRAESLKKLGLRSEALASLDRCIALAPQAVAPRCARATLLREMDRVPEALEECERAVLADPQHGQAWGLRGLMLFLLMRHGESEASFERALQLDPRDRPARFNLGLLRLTLGRFESGWEGNESRETPLGHDKLPFEGAPLWQPGETIAGKTVVLLAEQGLGDTIQFCRYAPVLARAGARVVLSVPRSLHRLLGSLGEGVQVLGDGDAMPSFDLQCWLMSVAHRLGTRLETIPGQVPYLKVPPGRLAHWRGKLGQAPGRRLRVGLVCSGSAGHVNDRNRSIGLARLAALIGELDCEWHLLQNELRGEDEPWLQRLGIVDHRAELDDFCETGALASSLDAVVSVDTSVAHVAGALGLPLYLLLPANPDWRWMLERANSPWYPTAQLLRQAEAGNWERPLEQLRQALQALAPR
jgi:tetratricopeptide (TPR) repeat protein